MTMTTFDYNEYFSFDSKPFNVKNPKFYYFSGDYQYSYQRLLAGLRHHCGVAVLTGEAGTGKSLLLRKLIQTEAEHFEFIPLSAANLEFAELLERCCDQLSNISITSTGDMETTSTALIDAIKGFLQNRQPHEMPVVFIVDEAHTLNDADLTSLLQLLKFLTDSKNSLQILLTGLPVLARNIEKNIEPRALADVVYANLPGFNLDQVAQFVYWQIANAGGVGSKLFPQAVIGRIFMHTRGIPRLINAVCDHALLATQLISAKQVSQSMVDEVANELMTYDHALFLDPEKTVEIPVIRADLAQAKKPEARYSAPAIPVEKPAPAIQPKSVEPPDRRLFPEPTNSQAQPDHTLIHGFTKVIDIQQIQKNLLKPRRRWFTLVASVGLLVGGIHLIQAVYSYRQNTHNFQPHYHSITRNDGNRVDQCNDRIPAESQTKLRMESPGTNNRQAGNQLANIQQANNQQASIQQECVTNAPPCC